MDNIHKIYEKNTFYICKYILYNKNIKTVHGFAYEHSQAKSWYLCGQGKGGTKWGN